MNYRKVKISEVCTIEKGQTGITKAIPGPYPMVALSENRKTHNEYQFDTKAVIIPLVSSTGHGHASMKRIHYQKGKFALGTILCALLPKDDNVIDALFLYHYLNAFKEHLFVPLMRGMANVTLPMSKIKEVEVPLPSLEVQKEWILKFEHASTTEKNLTTEITHQQTLLSKLKQSILQDAISGKLTEQWRKENTDVEPAGELLNRIKAEKEKLVKDKKIKKEKPLPPIKLEEMPFELPNEWVWCRLGEITTYGTSKKIEPKEIANEDWVLDLEDIEKETSKILQFRKFENKKSNSTKSIFKKGYVLYSKLRPYLDKVVVAPKDGVCTTEILPLPVFGNMESEYFKYCLKRKDFLQYADSKVKGMKMPRLGTNDGKMALFPLTSLEEQSTVIVHLESLYSMCSKIETQIFQSKKNAELLMQAVLKESFESNVKEVGHV